MGHDEKKMAAIRGGIIGYVPQDPMSNLNPVWSVGFQVREAIRANGVAHGKKEIEARAIEVLQQAGLQDAERRLRQFPHQFSGGMRQRVLIGIGLGADPKAADRGRAHLCARRDGAEGHPRPHRVADAREGHRRAAHHARPGPGRGARQQGHRDAPGSHRRGWSEQGAAEQPAAPVHAASHRRGTVAGLASSRVQRGPRRWRGAVRHGGDG
ncbi:ATP-binding cassette domain-containing protein [Demequina litorisediminis]|uniref:ATP-binding cassette domain-containing protein n=1 Tax=Demequina litorisediminis TaxID=1849022 RepID=UPI003D665275